MQVAEPSQPAADRKHIAVFCLQNFQDPVTEMSAAGRAASASRKQTERELWALRDNVLRLEQELTVSQAQLDKVTRQLNCLVELLRK